MRPVVVSSAILIATILPIEFLTGTNNKMSIICSRDVHSDDATGDPFENLDTLSDDEGEEDWNEGGPVDNVLVEAHLSASGEPQTYKEAISCEEADKWKLAMQEEHEALLKNGT